MKGFQLLTGKQRDFTIAAVLGSIFTVVAFILVLEGASPLVWAIPSVLGACRGLISAGIMRDNAKKGE